MCFSDVVSDKDFTVIIKPFEQGAVHKDPRQRAGADAEEQMAHYLHRGFRENEEVFVLHNLRLEDQEQQEQDGSPGVCQIDHLVVHRWGLFIVESKSVTEEVRVRSDGSGGDEWTRVYQRKETGMPSPIRQAQRQSDFLRAFLQRHREELLGKHSLGLRTIAKITMGTDQRGFKNAPIQLMIAVSDKGRIKRIGGWKEPRDPFRVFVAKADLVPDKISQELEAHRKGGGSDYGLWSMEEGEPKGVAEFLAARHVDRTGAPTNRPKRTAPSQKHKRPRNKPAGAQRSQSAACKHCGSSDLTARWGKYGYHWNCAACDKNTAMPVECSACGAKKGRDSGVRVRKDKKTYFRDCEACGTSEPVWTED
ncbi:MAG: NERD domain-containing protein [Acidimicrobiia bacterium]|nr:NERD domain-containing protein [Acidimicrobiia bacterium]